MSLQQIPLPSFQPCPHPSDPLPVFDLPSYVPQVKPKPVSPSSPKIAAPSSPAPSSARIQEGELVRQAAAGDAQAFEKLFADNIVRVRRIAFSVLGNKEDAEDAVQDAFLSAFQALASFQYRCRFSTWLTRIVINSALMSRRRVKGHPEDSLDDILDHKPTHKVRHITDARGNPEQTCAAAEVSALIEKHIRRLPRKLQTAFRACDLQGLSAAESAGALNLRRTTFKARVFRARKRLATSLRPALRTPARKSAGLCVLR